MQTVIKAEAPKLLVSLKQTEILSHAFSSFSACFVYVCSLHMARADQEAPSELASRTFDIQHIGYSLG